METVALALDWQWTDYLVSPCYYKCTLEITMFLVTASLLVVCVNCNAKCMYPLWVKITTGEITTSNLKCVTDLYLSLNRECVKGNVAVYKG